MMKYWSVTGGLTGMLAGVLAMLALAMPGCDAHSGNAPISDDVFEAEGWRAEVVVDGLEHPWSIAWLPDGSALITERPGRLRLVRDGRLLPDPVSGLPPLFSVGQGGLLDVSLHPDFANNQWVYLSVTLGSNGANGTALARGRLVGNALRDVAIIFRNPDLKAGGQHFGSRLLWLPDQTLLMSIGDGGNPPASFNGDDVRKQAQNTARLFGKIVHLNADGSPADGNPFAGQEGKHAAIWSYGHRNIQGLARDPRSGWVWATEHGSRGGDELNLIAPGNNYGWPEVSYSNEYWGPRVSELSSRPDVTEPVLVWTPSKAPSGLVVYTGERFPQWQGDLFSGALKFQHIRRIKLKGRQVLEEEKLSIGRRVRDVRQGSDGYLYVLTDEGDGALLRIVPEEE